VTATTRQRAVVTLYGLPSGGMLRYIWGDGSAPEWVPIGADPASGEHVYSRGRGPYVLDVLAPRADNSYFGSGMIIVRTGEDPADVQPTITAVVPADGPDVGGSGVIIDGTGLTGSTAATFGGTPATGFFVVSDQSCVCTTPAGGRTVDVVVAHPAGPATLPDGFSYDAPRRWRA
jgi:hypothetical protein